MDCASLILEPCQKTFPDHYLIYELINAVKVYEEKTNQQILNITWNHYGYASNRFISYKIIKFTINNTTVSIYFGKTLYMLLYNVPGKNGVESISINDTTYYSKDNGYYTLSSNESVNLKDIINDYIESLK